MLRLPFVHILTATAFLANGFFVPAALAQGISLPSPKAMIQLSPQFKPSLLKGITVHPQNPLQFDFIVGLGDDHPSDLQLRQTSERLIKYFMASLTVPENEQWVNLSPYEKQRIVPQSLGVTDMGRDLLAQDYILKQITSSLMYPEKELGKKFWRRVYEDAAQKFGTTNVPVNTFNKVWIVPDKVSIYEHGSTAVIVENRLKVMLEQDYLAAQMNAKASQGNPVSTIVRELIIPQLEREVNEGKNFAQLRQVYSAMLLATWYKIRLKESLLGKKYVDQNKVTGVDIADKQAKLKIYQQYLEAFKKGVFNYIQEDNDPATGQVIPRKYFAGGTKGYDRAMVTRGIENTVPSGQGQVDLKQSVLVQADVRPSVITVPKEENGRSIQDEPVLSYSDPNLGIDLEIPKQRVNDGFSEKLAKELLAIAAGKKDIRPGVTWSGRSYIIPLPPQEQFIVDLDGKYILVKSLRLKGATYRGSLPQMRPYISGDNAAVQQSTNYLEIENIRNEDGKEEEYVTYKDQGEYPTGALYLEDAQTEYRSTKAIFEAGIPTALPIGVGRFSHMKFRNKDVGFIILAEDSDPILPRWAVVLRERIKQRVNNYLSEFAREVFIHASMLRKLNEAGFAHTNPHLEQYDGTHIYDLADAYYAKDVSRQEFIYRVLLNFSSFYKSVNNYAGPKNINFEESLSKSPPMREVYQNILKGYLGEDLNGLKPEDMDPAKILPRVLSMVTMQKTAGRKVTDVIQEVSQVLVLQKVAEIAGKTYDKANPAMTAEAEQSKKAIKDRISRIRQSTGAVAEQISRFAGKHLSQERKVAIRSGLVFREADTYTTKIRTRGPTLTNLIIRSLENEGVINDDRAYLKQDLERNYKVNMDTDDFIDHILTPIIYQNVTENDIDWEGVERDLMPKNGDPAQLAKGGIDLNPAELKMNIQKDKAMQAMDYKDFDKIDIQGLYPVIIKIAPAADLSARLGLNP